VTGNIVALDTLLATTTWPRHKLESVLGVTVLGSSAEIKRLAWRLILDDEARAVVDRIRLVFKDAKVEGIR
jgi:hypothetical protein